MVVAATNTAARPRDLIDYLVTSSQLVSVGAQSLLRFLLQIMTSNS